MGSCRGTHRFALVGCLRSPDFFTSTTVPQPDDDLYIDGKTAICLQLSTSSLGLFLLFSEGVPGVDIAMPVG